MLILPVHSLATLIVLLMSGDGAAIAFLVERRPAAPFPFPSLHAGHPWPSPTRKSSPTPPFPARRAPLGSGHPCRPCHQRVTGALPQSEPHGGKAPTTHEQAHAQARTQARAQAHIHPRKRTRVTARRTPPTHRPTHSFTQSAAELRQNHAYLLDFCCTFWISALECRHPQGTPRFGLPVPSLSPASHWCAPPKRTRVTGDTTHAQARAQARTQAHAQAQALIHTKCSRTPTQSRVFVGLLLHILDFSTRMPPPAGHPWVRVTRAVRVTDGAPYYFRLITSALLLPHCHASATSSALPLQRYLFRITTSALPRQRYLLRITSSALPLPHYYFRITTPALPLPPYHFRTPVRPSTQARSPPRLLPIPRPRSPCTSTTYQHPFGA